MKTIYSNALIIGLVTAVNSWITARAYYQNSNRLFALEQQVMLLDREKRRLDK